MANSISQISLGGGPKWAQPVRPVETHVPATAIGSASVAPATELPPDRVVQAAASAFKVAEPDPLEKRSEISFDEASQRFVARLIDREGGEVVVQYPTKEELHRIAISREQFDQLLSLKV